MVQVTIRHELAEIELQVAVEVEVRNSGAIVRERHGRLAGMLSELGFVRCRVDAAIHDQIVAGVEQGLGECLRAEVLARLEQGLADALRAHISSQLVEHGVAADVRVTVEAS